jgi:hypothetical protein
MPQLRRRSGSSVRAHALHQLLERNGFDKKAAMSGKKLAERDAVDSGHHDVDFVTFPVESVDDKRERGNG